MIEDELFEDKAKDQDETTSHESESEEAKPCASQGEAKLSLNAMAKVPQPSSKRVMACIEKFEVTLLVDNDSTYNFINFNIVIKVRLKPVSIAPFEVKVINGNKFKCEGLVCEVRMNIQGV